MSTKQREKAALRRQKRQELGPSAQLKWLRMSPRKVRLVIDLIRGKSIEEALNLLKFNIKAASKPVLKLLKSAIANADNRDYDLDHLYIQTAVVDEGPTWRRWLPRAMGRATRIRKRTSHIKIILGKK